MVDKLGRLDGGRPVPTTAADVTQELLDWIRAAAGGAPAAVKAAAEAPAEGVDLRLLAMTPRPAPRPTPRTSRPPAVLALDYLLTVRGKDPLEEHSLAAELMFAALELQDVEVLEAPSAAAAAARLGMPPAAGFVLRTCLSRERERARAPLVRFPPVARTGGLGQVEGVVLGPGDAPVPGALVSLVGLGRMARTDPDGRFRISGPPPGAGEVRLRVRAKGVETEALAAVGKPAVLHLEI